METAEHGQRKTRKHFDWRVGVRCSPSFSPSSPFSLLPCLLTPVFFPLGQINLLGAENLNLECPVPTPVLSKTLPLHSLLGKVTSMRKIVAYIEHKINESFLVFYYEIQIQTAMTLTKTEAKPPQVQC